MEVDNNVRTFSSTTVQVISCLDDDNQSTRLVSCKVLRLILLERPASLNGRTSRESYFYLYPQSNCLEIICTGFHWQSVLYMSLEMEVGW